MALIQQSTTYTRSFLMVYNTDHLTGATGVTITVNLSKSGGVFIPAVGSVAGVSSGVYTVSLTAADTNTLGDLMYYCTGTNVDPTNFTDQIIGVNLNNLNVTSGTTLQVIGSVTAGTINGPIIPILNVVAGTVDQPVKIASGTYAVNLGGSVNSLLNFSGSVGSVTGSVGSVNSPVTLAAGTYAVNLGGSINSIVQGFTLAGGTYAINIGGSVNNVIQSTTTTITGGTISGVSGSVGSVVSPVSLASGTYAVNIGGSVNNIIIPPALSLAAGTYAVNLTGSVNNVIVPQNVTVGGGVNVTQWAGGTCPTPFVTGQPIVTVSSGTLSTVSGNVIGSVASVLGSVNSVTNPISLSSGTYSVNLTGSINNVINSVNITGGTISAVTGSVGSVIGSVGSVTGSVGSVVSSVNITGGTISAVSGSVGSIVNGVTVTTNNDKNNYNLTAGTQSGVIIPSVVNVSNVLGNVNIASQQILVKKNAALNGFMFLMLLSSDHVTPATGLIITSQVSINGGGFSNTINSATEISAGIYTINLTAADTNGNTLMFKFSAATADNRYIEIITQA